MARCSAREVTVTLANCSSAVRLRRAVSRLSDMSVSLKDKFSWCLAAFGLTLVAIGIGCFVAGRLTAPTRSGSYLDGYTDGQLAGVEQGRLIQGSESLLPAEAKSAKDAYANGYQDGANGPVLIKEPKLLINDDNAGKPEGIHLMIGRRPYLAFGNSTGDRQMLEYTKAGQGARLAMLVLHDDAAREYAYGPAQGLPDTKVGRFTPELYDQAIKDGWNVVSMKNDWKRVFTFE